MTATNGTVEQSAKRLDQLGKEVQGLAMKMEELPARLASVLMQQDQAKQRGGSAADQEAPNFVLPAGRIAKVPLCCRPEVSTQSVRPLE